VASIVGVHGIGQQVKGPEVVRAAWAPALRDGVRLAGGKPPAEADIGIAFYGDLFRKKGKSVGEPVYTAVDVEPGFETELLEAWWLAAAAADPAVPGPDEKVKARTPATAQRALDAVSRAHFFSGLAERLIIWFAKQVHLYLTDDGIRASAQERVAAEIGQDTRVLIGHSLGSVVAYEALCAHPEWPVRTLVTLGSPLGIPNLIFDRLRPAPVAGQGRFPWPGRTWTNIADAGDAVALVKKLRPLFAGGDLQDRPVHNGSKAHDASPYLTAAETGRAVVQGLDDERG
jgi:hypothetical protein